MDHFIPPDHDTPPSVDEAIEITEGKIRRLLLELEEYTERPVASVSVDMRVPANLMVTVKLHDF